MRRLAILSDSPPYFKVISCHWYLQILYFIFTTSKHDKSRVSDFGILSKLQTELYLMIYVRKSPSKVSVQVGLGGTDGITDLQYLNMSKLAFYLQQTGWPGSNLIIQHGSGQQTGNLNHMSSNPIQCQRFAIQNYDFGQVFF